MRIKLRRHDADSKEYVYMNKQTPLFTYIVAIFQFLVQFSYVKLAVIWT